MSNSIQGLGEGWPNTAHHEQMLPGVVGGQVRSRIVVQKYGGTSVGSVERLRAVARRCLATQRSGRELVVVVSAMSGETNRLLALAHEINGAPSRRELDVVSATGEQVSVGLLALAIDAAGGKAMSFLGCHRRRLRAQWQPKPST